MGAGPGHVISPAPGQRHRHWERTLTAARRIPADGVALVELMTVRVNDAVANQVYFEVVHVTIREMPGATCALSRQVSFKSSA